MKKKIGTWWKERRSSVGLLCIGLLALGALYLTKLGSLVPGNSMYEKPEFLGVLSKQMMVENIAYAPLKFIQALAVKIDDPNATLLRIISAAVMAIAVLSLYLVLERWHTRRIALFGAALFASSTYSLHQGRFAGHEVMYLAVVPVILLAGVWLRSKRHVTKLPVALIIAAILLYVPGIWLLLLILALVFRKRLLLAWKFVDKKYRIIGIAGVVVVVSPLIYSLGAYPKQLTLMLGIDRLTQGTAYDVVRQFIEIPKQVLLRGPNQPAQWLVGTPILDIATFSIALLGVYSYLRGRHPLRARLLGLMFVFGLIMSATSMNVTVAFLLPIAYILAANGLAYLLQSWFTVFPRNPAARSVGLICVVVMIGIIATYHMKRYYVAWPSASATKQALSTRVN